MLEVPSKVTDEKFIRMPNQDKVVESDDEWNRCGKWILLNISGSMTWIDETWIKLQPLLKEGHLLMIKASTAAMPPDPKYPGNIMCFTRPGEKEIERVAKEIRKVVRYEGSIYYKTNNMTENKIDRRYGHKINSCYMHTFKGLFYRRGPANLWNLVNVKETEERRNNLLLKQQLNTENFAESESAQLISRSKDVYLTMQSTKEKLPTLSFLFIYCSLEEVENTLSEADRMWIIGKKLIDKGIVYKISCLKESNIAKFRFLVLEKLDKESSIKLCEKIHEAAPGFIYVKIIGNIAYRYSPAKEIQYLIGRNYKRILQIQDDFQYVIED